MNISLNTVKDFITNQFNSNFCQSISKRVNWIREKSSNLNPIHKVGLVIFSSILLGAVINKNEIKKGFNKLSEKGNHLLQSIKLIFSKRTPQNNEKDFDDFLNRIGEQASAEEASEKADANFDLFMRNVEKEDSEVSNKDVDVDVDVDQTNEDFLFAQQYGCGF